MYTYDTVSEAVNDLKNRGYNINFKLADDHLYCPDPVVQLKPEEFEISEVYRFEGNTDPADEAIVYAIESIRGQKGVLVNAYGAFSDTATDNLVKKLQVHRN